MAARSCLSDSRHNGGDDLAENVCTAGSAGGDHQENPMPKSATPAAKRPAPKMPVTKEAVQRIQRSTAAVNGGQQAPWVRRLQSKADKQGQ